VQAGPAPVGAGVRMFLAGGLILIGIDRAIGRDMTVIGRVGEQGIEMKVLAQEPMPVLASSASIAVRINPEWARHVEPVLKTDPRETFDSDPWRRRGKRRGGRLR
jgi:hypothetical protein